MWARLKRLFRAIFGGVVESMEDPELILKQVIRDMNDKIPQMRMNVVQVMSTEKKLAKEIELLERGIVESESRVKAAVNAHRDDVAKLYISQMQEKQASLERSRVQHSSAVIASTQAKKFLDSYIIQLKRRASEAQTLVNQARASQMQEQLAEAMTGFRAVDEGSTFDEMRERINQRAAAAEAKMDLATNSIEGQIENVERDALDMQVEESLNVYKRAAGLDVNLAISSDKSLGGAQVSRALE